MQAPVAAYMRQLASQPLPSLLRSGCGHLMQACAQESQLFEQFFPATAARGGGTSLAPLVDPLCTLLYDAVRPALITVQDIDGLCELVDILRTEVTGWLLLACSRPALNLDACCLGCSWLAIGLLSACLLLAALTHNASSLPFHPFVAF